MNKVRLTITLSEYTLFQIDQLIDKKQIRSRSHAIETILNQHLNPALSTAVVLAGNKKPKKEIGPLLEFENQPLIFYTLEHLHKFGIKQVYILTNQAGKKIETLLKKHPLSQKIKINYLYEKQALGTAGALNQLRNKLNKPFLLIHGDVLTDIDIHDLANFHFANQSIVTIAVKPRIPQDYYNNVFMQGSKIVDFAKKQQGQIVSIVNAGIYVFDPKIFNYLPKKIPAKLEDDVFPSLIKKENLRAFPFQGMWFDISVDTNYKK